MHYCISDIHGEFDRYQAMLEEIHLTDDDTLYVIGDAIDRAPGGIDVLEDIMARKNVVMLKVPQHKDNNKTDFAHQRERVCGNPQALLFAHVKKERR